MQLLPFPLALSEGGLRDGQGHRPLRRGQVHAGQTVAQDHPGGENSKLWYVSFFLGGGGVWGFGGILGSASRAEFPVSLSNCWLHA